MLGFRRDGNRDAYSQGSLAEPSSPEWLEWKNLTTMAWGSCNEGLLEKDTEDEKQELNLVEKELVDALMWFKTS
ncbi:unnamed protein product [Dovyalis caffra]|uniref:Uncharacterized protein n=1 Tax=Dovyalis caffra TaxID=77055 RepID=A0AAV1RZD8_9ROSI|nr:unnamed protein product [Dovyalis caffra]